MDEIKAWLDAGYTAFRDAVQETSGLDKAQQMDRCNMIQSALHMIYVENREYCEGYAKERGWTLEQLAGTVVNGYLIQHFDE